MAVGAIAPIAPMESAPMADGLGYFAVANRSVGLRNLDAWPPLVSDVDIHFVFCYEMGPITEHHQLTYKQSATR